MKAISVVRFVFVFMLGLPLQIVAQQGLVIESLHFMGNKEVATRTLKFQMVTKATPWYDVLPFVEPRIFDAGLFQGDLQRLQKFYQSQGFYQASIDTTLRIDKKNNAHLHLRVQEGPRSYIAALYIEGLADEAGVFAKTIEDLNNLQGTPFVQSALSGEVGSALRKLRNRGYGFAKADVSSYADSLKIRVDITFSPGPLCEIADVQITGNQNVTERTIRRGMTFTEGDVFDGSQLDDSRRQLYRSGVFRAVLLELPDTVAKQTPVRVRVTERPFRSVTLGGGYDTKVGFQTSAAWMHRNFGGGARQLRVSGKLSTESRGVVVGVREPYFWGSRNWLNLSGFLQKRKQAEDEQDEVGGSASFERNLADRLDLVLQVSGGLVDTNVDSAFSEFRMALRWDSRDDLFDPQKGILASLTLRERGWWLQSSWEFWEVTAEGRWFLPLPLQSVLGMRVLGGAIFRINTRAAVPDIERYYSGGLNSVRGWGNRQLGPKVIQPDPDSDTGKSVVVPFGGTRHLEGSVELRTRILSFLGAAVFIDAARVANDNSAYSISKLQWAVGAGARLITPIGPVRFDAGYRLSSDFVLDNDVAFDSRWQYHLSLGQAF